MSFRVHLIWSWFEVTTLVGIRTYWIGRYKPIFHTTMTTESHACSMLQNAVIRNVAININRGMLLVDNSVLKMYLLNSQLSLKIKSLTFTFISFFDIPGKTICWKYVTTFQTDMGVSVWRKIIFDIYVTEYGTALTTIWPILFLYLNTDSRNLWTVMRARALAP